MGTPTTEADMSSPRPRSWNGRGRPRRRRARTLLLALCPTLLVALLWWRGRSLRSHCLAPPPELSDALAPACLFSRNACVLSGDTLLVADLNGSQPAYLHISADGRPHATAGRPPDASLLASERGRRTVADCRPTLLLLTRFGERPDLPALRAASWVFQSGNSQRQIIVPSAPADAALPPAAASLLQPLTKLPIKTLAQAADKRTCFTHAEVCYGPGLADLHAFGRFYARHARAKAFALPRAGLDWALSSGSERGATSSLSILFLGVEQLTDLPDLLMACQQGIPLPGSGSSTPRPAHCSALPTVTPTVELSTALQRADAVVAVGSAADLAWPFMQEQAVMIEVVLPNSAPALVAQTEQHGLLWHTLLLPPTADTEARSNLPWEHLAQVAGTALKPGAADAYTAARAAGQAIYCSSAAGLVPAPGGVCATRPRREPVLAWNGTGYIVWQMPTVEPKGTVILFNGACRMAEEYFEHWPDQRRIEHVKMKNALLDSGYAVISTTPMTSSLPNLAPEEDPDPALALCSHLRCCYDARSRPELSKEAAAIRDNVRMVQEKEGLQVLPVYVLGWSSGGVMAAMLPAVMDVQGVALIVSAIKPSWLEGWTAAVQPYPPVAFVHMQRDSSTIRTIEQDIAVLRSRRVPSIVLRARPHPLDNAFIRSRLDVSEEQAEQLREVLLRHKVLTRDHKVAQDYMTRWTEGWMHIALTQNVSVTAGQEADPTVVKISTEISKVAPNVTAGDVNDLLQVAHAHHFVSAQFTHHIMHWFSSGGAASLDLKALPVEA